MLPRLYIEQMHFGCESNLWWLERVIYVKMDGQEENASLVRTTIQTHDGGSQWNKPSPTASLNPMQEDPSKD